VKFLVDNQLPTALARWMVDAGLQADHVLHLAMEHRFAAAWPAIDTALSAGQRIIELQ
jgi:predicted nuclease of predicted toxin-antitoxin system